MPEPSLYADLAQAYATHSETMAYNAHYERPALLSLLPDLAGCDVLDVGCGAGPVTEVLLRHGARPVGLDLSAELVALAAKRCPEVPFHVGDLADPLPFADARFDGVTASLCLHYLEDWRPTLGELARVLRPGGWLVMSTHHPMSDWNNHPEGSYLRSRAVEETWTVGGQPVQVRFVRRPLGQMTADFAVSGLVIETLLEPEPAPSCAEVAPEAYARLQREPAFILFKLRKSSPVDC